MTDRTYEVRISGLVPTEELATQLREVRVAEHELRTVLSGRFADQAELGAFLNLLRSYGLEIVDVRRVLGEEPEEDAQENTGAQER